MITNESEIRVALQTVLITVLALNGYWGAALLMVLVLIPWRPLFAAGSYLAQPVVDWREQKARDRKGKGIAQVEAELDELLRPSRGGWGAAAIAMANREAPPAKSVPALPPRSLEAFDPLPLGRQSFQKKAGPAADPAAALAIPLAIKDHVRNLRKGVLIGMELEVDDVELHGESAEADVRFRSPHVSELIIRQRYTLHKSGEHWQVEIQ